MKAFLMYDGQDIDSEEEKSAQFTELSKDLDLTRLLTAMADEDQYLYDMASKTFQAPLTTVEAITYRQHNLIDALEQPQTIRALYALAEETIAAEKKIYHSTFFSYPSAVLRRSIESLELLIGMMRRLRVITDENKEKFTSPGFTRFFSMVTDELNDEYFKEATKQLDLLRLRHGFLMSAKLGYANKGIEYTLRRPNPRKGNWWQRIFTPAPDAYSFGIAPRDEAGARALSDLQDRGISLAARALDQADAHVVSFFRMLRAELAFYVGCLNLREVVEHHGGPICVPLPETVEPVQLGARNLTDLSLVLNGEPNVTGNDIDAEGINLIMVTGANEGGKSTFLSSLGVAQLMMQCGMFVCADYFNSSLSSALYTHYKREEDTQLRSGKLDEELERMSSIADQITPHALILFNESFSATNEREGSAIARNIISALLETNMRVVFVTHFFDLSRGLYEQRLPHAMFLKAQRETDGRRTHRIVEGEPERTSYGKDLYDQVFGSSGTTASA